jgi:amino acid transporter
MPQAGADTAERRTADEDAHKLTAVEGLAALSLDALSSVAYGPEAIVLALVVGGSAAIQYTLPVTVAIVVLLLVLVVSYRQVIAVHPDGGGAYAVAKRYLGRRSALLAAASLVVDYVLTVAVSLAAGAASLASVFPSLHRHLLLLCLLGLALLTVLNLIGIAESARVLMLPTVVFIVAIVAIIVVGLSRSHPVAIIGTGNGQLHATEAVGIVLLMKAFAAGCSALTGVEAIANGVPAFKAPAVRRAQRTELSLGILLGAMLIGLAVLITTHHVVPRGHVTILAQLSAAAFGTGWPFYVTNLTVTMVLAFAANTSFGGLPVLMGLLAKDNRLPHLFGLHAERPVYRYGVSALALCAAALLIVVGADTNRLLPLFAIGVFIGFTISQVGLVRHWWEERPRGWVWRAALNGFGAVLTAIAAVVFFLSKFTAGAWLLLLIIPGLMWMFASIERYYNTVAVTLGIGKIPPPPMADASSSPVVIVPIVAVNRLTELALRTALQLGGRVIPVAVDLDPEATETVRQQWERWNCGLELVVLPSEHRALVGPVVDFVQGQLALGHLVTVLLTEVEPRRRRYQVLHNQRGLILAAALRSRTDAVVAIQPFRL